MKVKIYNRQDVSCQDKILFDTKYLVFLSIHMDVCAYVNVYVFVKVILKHYLGAKCIQSFLLKKSAKILISDTPYYVQYLQKVNKL